MFRLTLQGLSDNCSRRLRTAIVFRQWGEWSGPGKVYEKCDAIWTKALREKRQNYNA